MKQRSRAGLVLPFLFLLLNACDDSRRISVKLDSQAEPSAAVIRTQTLESQSDPSASPVETADSVVRINSTLQSWNAWQPWEKDAPSKRRALGIVVAPRMVLTTAEMAADAIVIEFESIDGTRFLPAKTVAIDYEANLALLTGADDQESARFFEGTHAIPMAPPPAIGDEFEIIQVETHGTLLETTGKLQSVSLQSPLVASGGFLTYLVKASMQDAASSFSLPVLRNGALAGLLFSYDAKDQICEISSTEIVQRFLAKADDGNWSGFPNLGISVAFTDDPSLRKWLQLGDDQGGIYISSVRKGSAAEQGGLQKGDVILSVDGNEIDRRGYCQHPIYGNLSWGHWIRGEKSVGDPVELRIVRNGKPETKTAILAGNDSIPQIVPMHSYDRAPDYLVKGGMVFQELSVPILQKFGKDWRTRAPLDLLDAMENPENYEDKVERIVFLSGVIPTPATIGYENLRHLMIEKVNGRKIRKLSDVVYAFNSNSQSLHSIEFAGEPLTIHLDEVIATQIDSELMQRGLRSLSRVSATEEDKPKE